MSKSRSWKDNINAKEKRDYRRYGRRDNTKYNTLFMVADEQIFGKEED